jgi:NTE family protein
MKIGLALSGGGVRAAAQLGIVKALYEAGIKPEIFTGTSGGSIAATLLALGMHPDKAFEFFKQTNDVFDIAYWHIIKGLFTKSEIQGLIKGKKLENALDIIFDGKSVSDINVPYAVVSTDLETGKEIIFSNVLNIDAKHDEINNNSYAWLGAGLLYPLKDVVRASCNFPGVFIPKKFMGYTLVDGGLTNNLPSDIAKALGADRVISISLANQPHLFSDEHGVISILSRSFGIIFDRDEDNNSKDFDILLTPNVDSVGIFSMNEITDAYNIGYEYGKSNVDIIKLRLGL